MERSTGVLTHPLLLFLPRLSTDVLVNGIVECFARVVGTTGDMYIRLHRGGWLFATRDGEQTLQPLSTTSSSVGGGGGLFSTTALPLDRVRALALRCGAYENYFNGHSRVVFFIKDGTRINVYYTTGTVVSTSGSGGKMAGQEIGNNTGGKGTSCWTINHSCMPDLVRAARGMRF